MKLKNKLLPILTGVSIASVVAPLVTITSCSNGMKTYDLLKDNLPAVQPSGLSAATNEEAIAEYATAIKQNPNIFINDYVSYLQTNVIAQELLQENVTFNKFNVSISTPSVGSVKISYPGEEGYTYTTISFKMSIDEEHTFQYDESSQRIATNGTLEYKNIPLMVYYDSSTRGWVVGIGKLLTEAYSFILENHPEAWSVVGEISQTYENKYNNFEKTDITTNTMKINFSSINDIQKYWGNHFDGSVNKFTTTPTAEEVVERDKGVKTLAYLDQFLFHFKSTYLYSVDKKMEIVLDEPLTFEVDVDPSLAAKKIYPAKINGFKLSGRGLESNTYTMAQDYTLDFMDVMTFPETTNIYDLYEKFYNAKLVIKAGTPITVDEDNYMTIESADSTNPTIYLQFPENTTIKSGEIDSVVRFDMKKQLVMNSKNEAGETTQINVSTYPQDNSIECQLKGMLVPQADKVKGQTITVDVGGEPTKAWGDIIGKSYVEIPFTFTGIASNLYFINDAELEDNAEKAKAAEITYPEQIQVGELVKKYNDEILKPIVMDSRWTEVVDSADHWWWVELVISSQNGGFLRFYPTSATANYLAQAHYYGYSTYTAKFNTSPYYYASNYYPWLGVGYYPGSTAQAFQYWLDIRTWDFTFKIIGEEY